MAFLTFMYLYSTFLCIHYIYKLKQKYIFQHRISSSLVGRRSLGCGRKTQREDNALYLVALEQDAVYGTA